MVTKVVMNWWHHLLEFKYSRHGLGIGILLLLAVISYVSYGAYREHRHAQAQMAFAGSYALFEQAVAAKNSKEEQAKAAGLFEEATMAFNTGYTRYQDTQLAPLFLAFQAEISVQRGNLSQACGLMDAMLQQLGSHSPVYGVYAVKRALMKLDGDNEQMRRAGLQELIALSEKDDLSRDTALYYLGEYYWAQHDFEHARKAWEQLQLVGKQGKQQVPCPWLEQSAVRLQQLSLGTSI